MHCPNADSLLEHRITSHQNPELDYYLCPRCGGYWLSGFDANFLKSTDLKEVSHPTRGPLAMQGVPLRNVICPVCGKTLEAAHGENIPPDVLCFRCPAGHGFFFPFGELKKFKQAQEAKLAYHKLWQIPLSSVAGSLLMTIVGLILSGGLILGVIEGQRQQTITSQAKESIVTQRVYLDSANRAATFVVQTSFPTTLYLSLKRRGLLRLATADGYSHVLRLTGLSPGIYDYFFSFQKASKTLKTESYFFSLKD